MTAIAQTIGFGILGIVGVVVLYWICRSFIEWLIDMKSVNTAITRLRDRIEILENKRKK